MSTDATRTAAMEAVREQILRMIRQIDRRIAALTEKMNENYLHFFEWNAETMYQEHRRRKFYEELAERLESCKPADPAAWLMEIAQNKINEIARGSLTRNSTSPMANIAHLLDLQAKQEIITGIEGLAFTAKHAAGV